MFINCPYCKALVATDPATDLPPEQCPRCAAKLRETTSTAAAVVDTSNFGNGGTDAPAMPDLGYLLEIPAGAAEPANIDATTSPASELSSQIHRIVTGETPAPVSPSPPPGIAPISTLLRAAEAAPTSSLLVPEAEARPETEPMSEPKAAASELPQDPPTQVPVPDDERPDSGNNAGTASDDADSGNVDASPPVTHGVQDGPLLPAGKTAETAAGTAPATKALPSFARSGTAFRRSGFHWKISATIASLALLLGLQLLLADRAQLAADARWRPLVSTLCQAFGCTLPPWREPSAFAVLARDVRPHPSTPGALRVTASFRNDARWPQPWPRLRLTLSDVDGNPVATRDFSARDYLGAQPSPTELASGQSASIAMDVVEPAARSVAFDFELL